MLELETYVRRDGYEAIFVHYISREKRGHLTYGLEDVPTDRLDNEEA